MNVFFVVNRPHDWPFETPGVTVVAARAYLTEPSYAEHRSARVVNLCRSKRYASRGYYVSLLAEARGHRPLPGVKAIEDLQTEDPAHLLFGSFRDQLQQALALQPGDAITLAAYFGRDPSGELDVAAQQLFDVFGAPLLHVTFGRHEGEWCLRQARVLSAREIPPEHRKFAARAAAQYIALQPRMRSASRAERFAIAGRGSKCETRFRRERSRRCCCAASRAESER